MDSTVARPWYREPWPWILAAGPLIVVIAGIYTAWLAVQSNDGLVTDDYYRKGLAANQTIARSDEAARMGLPASGFPAIPCQSACRLRTRVSSCRRRWR